MKETVFIFQELFVAITFERYQYFNFTTIGHEKISPKKIPVINATTIATIKLITFLMMVTLVPK